MRSLWNDITLLWWEYKRQRSLHPRWRRLELIRAGLESLPAEDPLATLMVLNKEIRIGYEELRKLRKDIESLDE